MTPQRRDEDDAPEYVKGFGRAVRLASPHRFHSKTTREQVAEPGWLKTRQRKRIASTIVWVLVLAAVIVLRGWAGERIGAGLSAPLASVRQALELGGAVLLVFLGAFAFMRLGEAALRAVFDADDPMEWPREDVDWGEQTVVLDRDTIVVSMPLAERSYPWTTLTELTEDEVFIVDRRRGDSLVIPKDPADEDELRDRLLRGIMLAEPLR